MKHVYDTLRTSLTVMLFILTSMGHRLSVRFYWWLLDDAGHIIKPAAMEELMSFPAKINTFHTALHTSSITAHIKYISTVKTQTYYIRMK